MTVSQHLRCTKKDMYLFQNSAMSTSHNQFLLNSELAQAFQVLIQFYLFPLVCIKQLLKYSLWQSSKMLLRVIQNFHFFLIK